MSEKSDPEYTPDEAEPEDNVPDAVMDRPQPDPDGHTRQHHPLCDDNGWDHLGPCVIESEVPCPICNGSFVIAVAGPDENGQYDTDDCPCQLYPGEDEPRITGHPPRPFDIIHRDGIWTVETEWLNDDEMVLLAHAILSEVEIAMKGDTE